MFDILPNKSFGIKYNSNTNIFLYCNNFFAIENFKRYRENISSNNQLILKCNGKITYEENISLKFYFGSISIECKEMLICGKEMLTFCSFLSNRGIIILCDKDIEIENCHVLSHGYIYIKCNNLISNGEIHFVNIKHKFQKKFVDYTIKNQLKTNVENE